METYDLPEADLQKRIFLETVLVWIGVVREERGGYQQDIKPGGTAEANWRFCPSNVGQRRIFLFHVQK